MQIRTVQYQYIKTLIRHVCIEYAYELVKKKENDENISIALHGVYKK